MRDNVSPDSSREQTPYYENEYSSSSRRYLTAPTSITDLSEHFNQQSLTPRRSNDGSTPRAREQNLSLQSANSFSNRVCRGRPSINRLQCSSTHLFRTSALVEHIVQNNLPTYDPTYPNSMLDDSTSPSFSSDEQLSSATSYFGLTPLTSFPTSAISTYGSSCAQHSLRHSQSYKIDKDLRHSASRDGAGVTARMVKKKIRMRKSSRSLSNGTRKRRE